MPTISESLAQAISHYQAGKFPEAEQHCRSILREDPSFPPALHLLGVLAHHAGRHDKSIELIGRAIAIDPSRAEYHSNLGAAYRSARDLTKAIACWKEALRLDSTFADAHNNLGAALQDQGQWAEARTHHQEALRHKPDYAEAHSNLGRICKIQGQLQEAAAHYQQALHLKPTFVTAHINRAQVLLKQGKTDEAIVHFRSALQVNSRLPNVHAHLSLVFNQQRKPLEAIAHLRKAVSLEPRSAFLRNNLGGMLLELDIIPEAFDHLQEAVRLKPNYAPARSNLGVALRRLGRLEESMVHTREAIRLSPTFADAHGNLASGYLDQGHTDEARKYCLEALRLRPNFALQYYLLSELASQGHYSFDDATLSRMRELLAGGTLSSEDASNLHFALGGVLDKRKDYDQAFPHFHQANEARQQARRSKGQTFSLTRHRQFVSLLKATCTRTYFERVASFGLDTQLPVFIIGMPRSGTSLVEQILASHPAVFGAGELSDWEQMANALSKKGASSYPQCLAALQRDTAETMARGQLDRLSLLGGSALRVIDKQPHNFFHLGLIAALFPNARIIHCRRDPRDVCLSCYLQNFRGVLYSTSLSDLGCYYGEYESLMAHWRQVLPLRVHEVVYEELVANQEPLSRALIDFCGLEWDDRCLTFHENPRAVHTASKLEVRKPVYSSSVSRWRRYETHLKPLIDALTNGGSTR